MRVVGGGPGEKAGRVPRERTLQARLPLVTVTLLPEREVIGPKECPILYRWTFLELGRRIRDEDTKSFSPGRYGPKLMVHRFLPNADDRAVHDHPRGFLTFVVRGGYDDMMPCPVCFGQLIVDDPALVADPEVPRYATWMPCLACADPERGPTGVMVRERMCAGRVRYRPAEHRHRTRVWPSGCWTVVWMGPLRRRWGFWQAGRWMFWRDFEREYGPGMRCGEES